MKILIVGVFNDNSTNNGIANGFEKAGAQVDRYDYRERLAKFYDGHGKYADLVSIHRDNEIIAKCQDGGYDLVFFCKCNGVDIGAIKECNRHSQTFLWYMDPLNGNYNDELEQKIEACDYVGVAKWEVYERARDLNGNTHFLIEGFDPQWDYPIKADKKYNISFIGNPYGDRAQWLNGATILSNKYNVEHARAVGETKVNLNLTGGGGPSDRVYKVLAAGGFLLSQYYPYADKYGLIPGKDMVFAHNPAEMSQLAYYYLNNEKERNKIAGHGCQTVQKFSRDNFANQVIDIVSP